MTPFNKRRSIKGYDILAELEMFSRISQSEIFQILKYHDFRASVYWKISISKGCVSTASALYLMVLFLTDCQTRSALLDIAFLTSGIVAAVIANVTAGTMI